MKQKVEAKRYYRFFCWLVSTAIVTLLFFVVWKQFVTVNNQTMHRTGSGNLGMAIIIYALLYLFIGKSLAAFSIGAERRANTVAWNERFVFARRCA